MTNLALVIEDEDREAVLDWTRRALALGAGLTARYNLGIFCEEDGRLEETGRSHEALSLYRHAARRGDVEAAQEAVRLKRAGLGPRPSISRDQ